MNQAFTKQLMSATGEPKAELLMNSNKQDIGNKNVLKNIFKLL